MLTAFANAMFLESIFFVEFVGKVGRENENRRDAIWGSVFV